MEVILHEKHIDWQKTDVYAFGMVLATLWSSTGRIPDGGSFLEPHIPYQLGEDAKQALFDFFKANGDDSELGLIKLGCKSIPETCQITLPVRELLEQCFSGAPQRRMSLLQLLETFFAEFAVAHKRGQDLSV